MEKSMENISSSIDNRRIAMLIDGENAQPSLIENMVTETSKYGLITIRRIYGDWTSPQMKSWKDVLNTHAIQPIQQFQYTSGKNATDSALIIDSMDILHDGVVNGFCLVSSDSDYTRLATRIREKGLFVMGIGKKTTPRAFVNACEIFVFTENLVTRKNIPPNISRAREIKTDISPDLNLILKKAFEMAVQDNGWASLGIMGTRLRQLDSSFDTRTYGYKQLSQLMKANRDKFEIQEKKSKSGLSQISVKLKDEHT
jgi:uncharacterized LabA/DUF88 family protein